MARLDEVVPYSVALGNHDFDVVNDKNSAASFLAAFSPARWFGRNGFLGGSPDGRNTAQLKRFLGEEYAHPLVHRDNLVLV